MAHIFKSIVQQNLDHFKVKNKGKIVYLSYLNPLEIVSILLQNSKNVV